jgi:hypothetical protein
VALTALLGTAQSRSLFEVHRGRKIRIETARPQPVQLDGNEARPTAVLEILVEPGALQLVRPALPKGELPPAPPLPAAVAAARVWGPVALGAAGMVGLAFALWRKRPKG